MRRNLAVCGHVYALPLFAWLSACSNLSADQQGQVQQAVSVACNVDGVMVPVAQPIITSIGPGGATVAGIDGLLVHPAVVAACSLVNGTPASATPVPVPPTASTGPAN